MAEPWRPSIEDISQAFVDLADEVGEAPSSSIEPGVDQTIRHLLDDLREFVPGLDPAPDADAATAMTRATGIALERGDLRQAMSRALRGLSFAPHDPNLHYALSSAAFEAGSVELAVRLLCHTLWIHPGHQAAKADLKALSAFLEGAEGEQAA